jgi:hypothetical protein
VTGVLVNMLTTSEYWVVAPTKEPDPESVVVPVWPITVPGVRWP